VEAIEPVIRERQQRLSVTPEEFTVLVNADTVRLTQCIANLLANAAKFTPAGGDIAVSARVETGHVVVEVRDTGIGIAPDLLPRVFDLFVQGQKSLDRSEGGLGIGLSVCKQLIEMHGGQVLVSSDGVGRGATFALQLPIDGSDEDLRAPPVHLPDAVRRVLVVDDNRDAADSTAALLEIDGHQVKAVYTPEAALDQFERLQPDLVVLDIGLPGMSGYEVAQRMKAARPSIYVVALSGYGRPEDRQRAQAAGFDAHLVKPVDFEELRRLVQAGKPN
jgi:CheY-like chemotaxis protein